MRKRHYLLIALIGLFLPSVLYAQPAPTPQPIPPEQTAAESALTVGQLSLADALERAAASSPLTQQTSASVAGATARLQAARALQDPTLSVAHWAGHGTGGLDEDIILTQIIELGGKRTYRTRSASAELTAAQYERIGAALDLRLAVQTAYYEALRAQEEYNLAAASLDVAQKFAEAAQTQYQAGDVAQSNVIRSQIELSRAQQSLSVAQTELENRKETVRSLTGQPAGKPLSLTDKLVFVSKVCSRPELETAALAVRPDIKAAEAMKASLVAAVGSAHAESRPDLFIEGRVASIDTTTDMQGESIRAGVIFTPWDYGQKRANIQAAQAAVTEQNAKIVELQRSARLEVQTNCRNFEQARANVESFENGRLTRAKQLLDMAQTGYEKGASTYLELLDAQNVYRNEQADYARALATYNIAMANLERATGGNLP